MNLLKRAGLQGLLGLLSPGGAAGRLTVLQFHRVPEDSHTPMPGEFTRSRFELLLDALAECARVLPLAEALPALQRGRLPRRAVCISFDDGYAEWVTHVAPALRQRNMCATFFITTGQLAGGGMWHERVNSAVLALPERGARLPEAFLGLQPLCSQEARLQLSTLLQEHLKYLPVAERDHWVHELERQAVQPLPAVRPFDAAAVRALHGQGFEIGAHTVHHPILNRSSDAVAMEEIGRSREELRGITGGPVRHFAYPNGRPLRDFSARHVEMVKACGYEAAVCTGGGVATAHTDPLQLPRFTPWGASAPRSLMQVARNLVSRPRLGQVHAAPRPPRVLVVENGAGFGGAIVALQTLLRHMPPGRMEVHLALNLPMSGFESLPCVRSTRVINDELHDFKPWAARIPGRAPEPLRRVLGFCLGRVDDLVNRLPYLLRLWAHARRVHPDLIHGNNEPASNREAMLVAKLLRLPYVQHLRGPYPPSALMHSLLRQPGLFVPVSRWLADDLLLDGVPLQRIRQLYDAVDLPGPAAPGTQVPAAPGLRQELGLPADAQLVAMVGMLVGWKGQDLFIHAVAEMAGRHPGAFFLLIGGLPERGDPAYPQRLQALVKRYGLAGRVRLLGRRQDMAALMPQLDVVVSASTRPEPLGLVMLESMAQGCVFVGPAFGAAVEVVQDGCNGFLFEPGSPAALAKALSAALDALGHTPLREAARAEVRHRFAPERACELALEAYAGLVPHLDWGLGPPPAVAPVQAGQAAGPPPRGSEARA
jgi:glycosyltransferase involved in cell wall biosynthesis/peptidoglycan/xylan/chitin deacetylase (PgdA/CDA1 family)